MPRAAWLPVVVANLAELRANLQICTGCACVFWTGEINLRKDEDEPYTLTGRQIHLQACTRTIGRGPKTPPIDPTAGT